METEKKERPILFSTPMVKAILEGRKTQTRRIVKVTKAQGITVNYCNDRFLNSHGYIAADTDLMHFTRVNCPYGKVGDLLYVKESFYAYGYWVDSGDSGRKFVDRTLRDASGYGYVANGEDLADYSYADRFSPVIGWWKRPSVFMPKHASRITLEITNIRVERLQDISEEDAEKEGVGTRWSELRDDDWSESIDCPEPIETHRNGFKYLWNYINGADSWARNGWVWVVEFKKL